MGTVQFKTQEELADERLANWRASAKVSKFQAKAALKKSGLLGRVRSMMKSLGEDDITRIAWEDAQEFRRESPTVLHLAVELELTDEDLDTLFEQAKEIDA